MVGEILNINNEYKSYRDYKAAVDEELKRSAEGFVRIGYLLKVARDTDILVESGYKNVNDFAQAEYGLDKSQVSRFIRVNDKFSEGGYSDQLQEKFQRFGYTKLSIMLMLPTAVNEELTESFSKTDIIAVKEEVEAEQKISDLEVMMEEKDQGQQAYGIFAKVLHQLGRDKPELYLELFDVVENTVYDGSSKNVIKKIVDVLAPAGEALHSVRIAGEGRKLLSIKGETMEPVVTDIRSGEKEKCAWDELIQNIESLCVAEEAKESWQMLYGEVFPEGEKKDESISDSRKQMKVYKAKEHKKNEKPVDKQKSKTESESTKDNGSDGSSIEREKISEQQSGNGIARYGDEEKSGSTTDTAEQLPGQMSVENYPEMLPDNYKVAPVQPTIQGKLVKESMCLGELKEELDQVYIMADKREYDFAKENLTKAAGLLERLQKFMEVKETNGKETA